MAARAGGTVFHYGIRLLTREQRAALGAIREFGLRIEAIASAPLDDPERLRGLDRQAASLRQAGLLDHVTPVTSQLDDSATPQVDSGASRTLRATRQDPVIAALVAASERFPLPVRALGELIEEARIDRRAHPLERFEDLLLHCRRQGGSLARLGVAVLPSNDPASAGDLAEQLGIALRLITIVGALRADAERGRIYLPAEDFGRYRLLSQARPTMTPAALAELARTASSSEPAALAGLDGGDQAQLYALMRFQLLRAGDWLHRGARLPALLDRRGGTCVLTVMGFYQRLLERIGSRPDLALQGRIALSVPEQAWLATRGLLRRELRERHPAERLPLD